MGQWSLRVWDFRPKDKQVGSIPFQQTPFVDWRGPWICAARDKTARGVALCWTYKSWARQCQLSKRTAQLSKVSPSLSLCLLSLLFIFFSASELLSARTQTIQFLFISPLHSSSSPTRATQHLPRLPHPPSHLSLFTPLRISPLKSILPPVVALILHPAVFSLSLYLPPPRYLPHLALIS